MKQTYKLLAAFTLFAGSMLAQQIIPCGTDQAMQDLLNKDPEARARYEKIYGIGSQDVADQRNDHNSVSSTYYIPDTVPVVIHILHQNGPENVSDATVYAFLAEVNKIHQKTNSDTVNIHSYFQPMTGDNNLYFKLATKDPNGNCTNGIIRHYDANTNWEQQNPGFNYSGAGAGRWPTNKYLNVYLVKNICPTQPCGGSGGVIVGYTYLGGTWPSNSSSDAIVYNSGWMTGANARSMAHEIGHWFGLPHTFGSTNSPGTCTTNSDDFLTSGSYGTGVVDDTPKTPGASSTCPPSTPNTCDASNFANVQNIMDYSSCPINFTEGQVKRMHNCMASSLAGRSNLMSAANKVATGVRYPQVCVPIAYFKATARMACPNTIITFSDSSFNARPTGWNWNFPGGTFQNGTSATDSMPQVSYAAPGIYAVSYTASTSAGGGTITKSNYIHILSNVPSYNTAWTEGFETSTLPGADWNTYSTPAYDWTVTNMAAASGMKCAMIDNTLNSSGTISTIETTSFDISSFTSPKLVIKLAYRQQTSTDNDKFQVLSSIDCGKTWTARMTRQGSALATVTPPSTSPFYPGTSNFSTYTVNINGVTGSSNVRFRFTFTADQNATGGVGNNIFLDDINLFDASVGIQNIEEMIGMSLYPNPTSGVINLDLNLSENHLISVSVADVLGRLVETIPAKQYGAGELSIGLAQKKVYQPGVYFVNVEVDGKKISKKVIVQ